VQAREVESCASISNKVIMALPHQIFYLHVQKEPLWVRAILAYCLGKGIGRLVFVAREASNELNDNHDVLPFISELIAIFSHSYWPVCIARALINKLLLLSRRDLQSSLGMPVSG